MLLAYLVMLLVMLYEAAIFTAVLLGLGAGYFVFELLSAKYVRLVVNVGITSASA
jgi:hypothetical protein